MLSTVGNNEREKIAWLYEGTEGAFVKVMLGQLLIWRLKVSGRISETGENLKTRAPFAVYMSPATDLRAEAGSPERVRARSRLCLPRA